MGIWNSFKNQIGRDAGKVVSNIVWKDKHASVYRRAESRRQETLDLKKKQFKAEQKQKILDREYKQQKDELDQIERLKNKTESKIQEINDLEIPEDKKQLVAVLNKLILLLKSNPFKDDYESDITNAYPKALLAKYEQALMTFESYYPKDQQVRFYKKQLKALKRQKLTSQFTTILAVIFLLLIISYGLIMVLKEEGII